MTKFDEFIKNLSTGELKEDRVKAEIKKMTGAAKLADNLSMNEICLKLREEEVGLIQYLVKKNEIKLLDFVLGLLDKTRQDQINALLLEFISEIISTSNIVVYDILVKHLAEPLKEIEVSIKHMALRTSTYRFIMHLYQNKMDDYSKEAVLEIAQNKHDMAYLLEKFSVVTLMDAVDPQNNNILHLALQSHNKNIFRYVINHAGVKLLYAENNNNVTPIDMVYANIKTTAERNKKPYDFSQLMLLDQSGADLATSQYADIRQAYQDLPEYHHLFLLAKQVKPGKVVNAVSFNGGGAKGQAFIAAYREALDRNIIHEENVRQYAGTSAGAITAGIFALNFGIDRCRQELNEFDFKKLMDEPTTASIKEVKEYYVKTWMQYFQQGAFYYLISDIITKVATESLPWGGGSLVSAIKQLVSEVTGIFKPTYLRKTLERLVAERIKDTALKDINPAYITFKDLKDHPDIFKELTVYITNLSTENTEKCSAETSPNMSIIDGIIYSASFPIFFEAAQKFEIVTNAEGIRERKAVEIDGKPVWCCDGGVLKNDPVDAFDTEHFNEHTLTFMLVSPDAKKLHEAEGPGNYHVTNSAIQVLTQLYKISRSAERKHVHADLRNHGRIVYIDTKNVGTLDFDHAKENAPILAAAGQDAVIDYLHRRTANGYSILRPETISLLMSYQVAKYSTGASGQVVEINPGKKLTPVQILRVYAAATNSELYMLRSIINPNQRDEHGLSAIAIANQLNFVNTQQRLQVAGARPAAADMRLTVLPGYLQRGEKFIMTAVSDADLDRRAAIEFERLALKMSLTKRIIFSKNTFMHLLGEKLRVKLQALRSRRAIAALNNDKLALTHTIDSNQQTHAAEQAALTSRLQASHAAANTALRLELQTTLDTRQQGFETEKKALQEQNTNLRTSLETAQADKNSTNGDLQGQREENTLLRKRYYFSRNTRNIKNVLESLRTYKKTLETEITNDSATLLSSGLAAVLGIYKSYLEANIQLKQTKMQGIDEVLNNLVSNYDQSASDIIQAAKLKHQGFFNGIFSHRTKTLCNKVIAIEEKIGSICGVLPRL